MKYKHSPFEKFIKFSKAKRLYNNVNSKPRRTMRGREMNIAPHSDKPLVRVGKLMLKVLLVVK